MAVMCGGEGDEDMINFKLECKALESKKDGKLMREVEGIGEMEALGRLLFKGGSGGEISIRMCCFDCNSTSAGRREGS